MGEESLGSFNTGTSKSKRTLNNLLIDQEEVEFQNNERILKQQMLSYTRSMIQMGNLSNKELDFLQQGVVFRTIKIGYFGMDPEELSHKTLHVIKVRNEAKKKEKLELINEANGGINNRPVSSDSNSEKSECCEH